MQRPVEEAARRSAAPRFLALTVIAAALAFAFFPADQRPTILRVALASALVTAFFHVVGRLIEALRADAGSGFARALERPMMPVRLDTALTQLGDEVRHSRTSQRYFDKILWPRLLALAGRRGVRAEALAPPVTSDPLGMRGPSLKSLSDLVDRLEHPR
ncbi:MAG: hypothetical protein FJX60_10510 [Alphaproteobacteria bacterium]|nr:hypothetical protein [Alphaproteobacteria bacterium]